jgi:cation/acetate symporter
VAVFGYSEPIFPYTSPTIFSMPLAFLTIWIISRLDRSGRAVIDREGYVEQRVRSETGIGSTTALQH